MFFIFIRIVHECKTSVAARITCINVFIEWDSSPAHFSRATTAILKIKFKNVMIV